jgi:hypothetical protein
VPIADNVNKRQQNVETGAQRGVVFTQAFNNIRTLLRYYDSRLGEKNNSEDGKEQADS